MDGGGAAEVPTFINYQQPLQLKQGGYKFEPQQHTSFNASKCPPWAGTLWKLLLPQQHEEGLFPNPPEPASFKKQVSTVLFSTPVLLCDPYAISTELWDAVVKKRYCSHSPCSPPSCFSIWCNACIVLRLRICALVQRIRAAPTV